QPRPRHPRVPQQRQRREGRRGRGATSSRGSGWRDHPGGSEQLQTRRGRGRPRQAQLRSMPRRVRAVSPDDRLSLVEHLDELRARIVVCIAVFCVALALCFWQNHLLLDIASGPLPDAHKELLTFGVTEPFTTTVTVAAYGAIIL